MARLDATPRSGLLRIVRGWAPANRSSDRRRTQTMYANGPMPRGEATPNATAAGPSETDARGFSRGAVALTVSPRTRLTEHLRRVARDRAVNARHGL